MTVSNVHDFDLQNSGRNFDASTYSTETEDGGGDSGAK